MVKLNPHNFNEKISMIHSKIVKDGYDALAEFPSLQPLAAVAQVEFNGKAIKNSSNFVIKNVILHLMHAVYSIRWIIFAIFAIVIIIILTYVCKAATVVGWTLKSVGTSCWNFCSQKVTRGAFVFKRKRKSGNTEESEITLKKLKTGVENGEKGSTLAEKIN